MLLLPCFVDSPCLFCYNCSMNTNNINMSTPQQILDELSENIDHPKVAMEKFLNSVRFPPAQEILDRFSLLVDQEIHEKNE